MIGLEKPFHWTYTGFITVLTGILLLFKWAAIGFFTFFKSLFEYIVLIIKNVPIGLYFVFGFIINPLGKRKVKKNER